MIELKSKINQDKYTEYVCEQFDIQNKEETSVSITMNLDGIDDMDWNIGVLYGGSGSGKTTILKHLGKVKDIELDRENWCIKYLDISDDFGDNNLQLVLKKRPELEIRLHNIKKI